MEGIGLVQNQWVAGSDYDFSRWEPSRFPLGGSRGTPEDQDGSHSGSVRIQSLNPFLIYGLSDRFNLLVRIPFLLWQQTAEEPDNHHRTESIAGLADLSVGARWLIANQSFGPGHRLFLGYNLTLPTAKSYETNPFSEEANLEEHRHFALGSGVASSTFSFEWWHRSEFPWVLGISGQYFFPWSESRTGFRPGRKTVVNIHGIRQTRLFKGAHPYLRIGIRSERPDHWENQRAANSGGITLDGMIGINLEITERMAAVISLNLPVWRQLEGNQLDPFTVSLSFRRLW